MGEPRETEVKLRVASAEAARRGAAAARRPRSCAARHFEDNVLFDDAQGSLRGEGDRAAPARDARTAAS